MNHYLVEEPILEDLSKIDPEAWLKNYNHSLIDFARLKPETNGLTLPQLAQQTHERLTEAIKTSKAKLPGGSQHDQLSPDELTNSEIEIVALDQTDEAYKFLIGQLIDVLGGGKRVATDINIIEEDGEGWITRTSQYIKLPNARPIVVRIDKHNRERWGYVLRRKITIEPPNNGKEAIVKDLGLSLVLKNLNPPRVSLIQQVVSPDGRLATGSLP